ncbi:MAG: ACP S-malonyltransferase [Candidatus Omnitrophica bacterium]|nr:ACP S-malonyltransferase [Candidatus Omnitrophota bacterium]
MVAIAYLLPGQGAQAVGMGKAFYDRFEISREIYKQANKALGFDVTALCFEGPPEDLTKTETCQPALFVTSMAAYAAFRETAPTITPVGVAGLSLGELTSLAVAEAFSLSDAFYLVKARGEAMAECAVKSGGAMLAVIGLTEEAINGVCHQSGATAANFNAPDQIVLSGTVAAIAHAGELAKAAGAKRAIRLEVAGAFHSPIMQPAAEAFKRALAKVEIRQPNAPVISNVTALPVRDPDEIRRLLVAQIISPVRWVASMRWMIQRGATRFIEFPPARVLTGLLRRIDASVTGLTIDQPSDFDKLSGNGAPRAAPSGNPPSRRASLS